jgi:hypothetical protein
VLDPARHESRVRAIADLDRVVASLRTAEQARIEAVEDPEAARLRLEELQRAQEGVARLREASSRWMVALNDGMTDLRSGVDYRLRSAMRSHLQEADRLLAEGRPQAEWDSMTEKLRVNLAAEAEGLFDMIRSGTAEVAERIATLIAEDAPASPLDGTTGVDVDELWTSGERELRAKAPGVFSSGLSVLRGGYTGMLMLGMLGQLAGIVALAPISLGVGLLFGARQFREERKRQQEKQRQEARGVIRQFLDQVQLELGTRAQRAIQDGHRALRDHFGERIQELSATYARAAKVLQESLAADSRRRDELVTAARRRIARLDEVQARVGAFREEPA